MKNYTVTLTPAEDLALSCIAESAEDWINNAVHERCRVSIDEIVKITVDKCLDEGVALPSTRDEIVFLAVSKGWIKPLAQALSDSPAINT